MNVMTDDSKAINNELVQSPAQKTPIKLSQKFINEKFERLVNVGVKSFFEAIGCFAIAILKSLGNKQPIHLRLDFTPKYLHRQDFHLQKPSLTLNCIVFYMKSNIS